MNPFFSIWCYHEPSRKELVMKPVFFIWCNQELPRKGLICMCFVNRSLSFFFCPLCCLFLFDVRILINPLVYLYSYQYYVCIYKTLSHSIINNIYSNDLVIHFYKYYSMILTHIPGVLDCWKRFPLSLICHCTVTLYK